MKEKLSTSINGCTERKCSIAIVLDIRSNRKDITQYPLCVRFTIDRKSIYHPIGGSFSKKIFQTSVTCRKANLQSTN